MPLAEQAGHQRPLDLEQSPICHGARRCHAQLLTRQASLAEELTGFQYCNDRFLAMTVLPRVIPASKDSQSTGWPFLFAITIPICLQTRHHYFVLSSAPPFGLASPPCHLTRFFWEKIFSPNRAIVFQLIIAPIKFDQRGKRMKQGTPAPPGPHPKSDDVRLHPRSSSFRQHLHAASSGAAPHKAEMSDFDQRCKQY
jgi:hypothetical protein